MLRPIPLAVLIAGALSGFLSWFARAQAPAPPPAATPACKAYGGAKCCDAQVTQHLPKEAVFRACRESDASFLGEKGSKDTCRYLFRSADGKEESFVEVYAPAQKDVPSQPNDPFFSWKKVGKVYLTDRATSPKSAPMVAAATGLWMPGRGFFVSVNAQTKVCTKTEAVALAKSLR
jgi:hypothetical protein